MLTKGIVINRVLNTNKYNVRIPYLEAPGMGPAYFEAVLATVPGISESLLPEDVVIIGFEDHHADKPIIVGKLFLQEESEPRGSAVFDSLNVTEKTNLPRNTFVDGLNVYKKLTELSRRIDFIVDNVPGETPTSGSVEDVTVNGTSVVSNGVAALVTNSTYDATNNKIATMDDVVGTTLPVIDLR